MCADVCVGFVFVHCCLPWRMMYFLGDKLCIFVILSASERDDARYAYALSMRVDIPYMHIHACI